MLADSTSFLMSCEGLKNNAHENNAFVSGIIMQRVIISRKMDNLGNIVELRIVVHLLLHLLKPVESIPILLHK